LYDLIDDIFKLLKFMLEVSDDQKAKFPEFTFRIFKVESNQNGSLNKKSVERSTDFHP